MNKKQIERRIEGLKKEITILESVLTSDDEVIMGRPIGSLKYLPEQIQFLRENKDLRMSDLVKQFNDKFKTSYPFNTRALYNLMIRENIIARKFTY